MTTANKNNNPVYLVGAGPGDPELLTVKAARLIGEAEVVVYDRLVTPEILALVPTGTTRIFAGKAARDHFMGQDEINGLLVSLQQSGRRVVRLKGGDPFVFGRGSEEAEHLAKAGIPFEVVPGITAAGGCAVYAGIPLTHRGLSRSVRFVTGHSQDGRDIDEDLNWQSLADPATTLVIYMGLTNARRISGRLIAAGLPATTPAAAIHKGTTPEQRTILTTLKDLPDCIEHAELSAPTLIIIGEVVRMADCLSWFAPSSECDMEQHG